MQLFRALLALGKPLLAVPHFRHVVLVDPTDRTASHVLGGVLGDMEPAAVANAYREVVRQQPDNVRAKHMLATLTGEGESSQVSPPPAPVTLFRRT